ncbi:MAG: uracil-DNA glycosylase [Candidatus Izemoplasmatales bacterium]|nr:uracil-DNA glycosylase [bacterium]MDZ4197195.1 uracil-DNA glycosylase [Candidatus Izemoplasmatales bacterium]
MLNNDWDELLFTEFQKPYFLQLVAQIKKEYELYTCYPQMNQVFEALRYSSFSQTKVVILGQDPYHSIHQAMGLSFSVPLEVEVPPSLQNIFKELNSDLGIPISRKGDLRPWAKQGVLLLNSILTVREHLPLSHQSYGWMTFTDHILSLLNQKSTPIVFVLWGSFSRQKKSLITNPIHCIIEGPHPSPLSAYRGFFGSKPFSKINDFLASTNQTTINFGLS